MKEAITNSAKHHGEKKRTKWTSKSKENSLAPHSRLLKYVAMQSEAARFQWYFCCLRHTDNMQSYELYAASISVLYTYLQ